MRKGAGVVELAALEMLCTSKGYRGFESHPFRHLIEKASANTPGLFIFLYRDHPYRDRGKVLSYELYISAAFRYSITRLQASHKV